MSAPHREPSVDLRGLWVPIVTPLTPGGEVDWAGLDRLARRLLTDGCAGLVALGTTGEPATLQDDERRQVMQICAQACADAGKPLMVGAGSNCTRSTIEAVAESEALVRPAAALIVVPYYTCPSEAAIVEHYRSVAAAVATPIVIYNIPYRAGRRLGADAIVELGELPQIVGLKQSVGALDQDTLEILRRQPAQFQVLAGEDSCITPTVLMGGAGAIAAAGHVCTPQFVEMIDAALAGDVPRARALASRLLPVVSAGYAEPSPALWKAALHAAGEIGSAALRAPMAAASAASMASLQVTVSEAATVA